MSLDFYVFADLPAEEFRRLWEEADSPEVQLLKTECFFGVRGIQSIEPGSYYEELCQEFGIQAQSLLYVSHNKSEIFTVNQMLYTIFEVVKPHEAKALFQGETLMDVHPDKIIVIPNEQLTSILVGQICRKIYEYGFCSLNQGRREYHPQGIVIRLNNGKVINCQRTDFAGLVFIYPSAENMESYESEDYFQRKTILFEGCESINSTISAVEQRGDTQKVDEVKIVVGNVSLHLYVAAYELMIQHTVKS